MQRLRRAVFARQIPVHPAAVDVARLAGLEPLELALNGGEDYELLCAVPERILTAWPQNMRPVLAPPLSLRNSDGKKDLEMITGGKREKISFTGYRHFEGEKLHFANLQIITCSAEETRELGKLSGACCFREQ